MRSITSVQPATFPYRLRTYGRQETVDTGDKRKGEKEKRRKGDSITAPPLFLLSPSLVVRLLLTKRAHENINVTLWDLEVHAYFIGSDGKLGIFD